MPRSRSLWASLWFLLSVSTLLSTEVSMSAEASTEKSEPGMPEINPECRGVETFGGTEIERAAYCLAEDYKFRGARTLADRALRENERSFRAHYLMGVVQHQGEGNLAKALYHFQAAENLLIEAYGTHPSIDRDSPAFRVYHRTFVQLVYVLGEMDHHEEKIHYVDDILERLGLDHQPLKAWPLLKLKRFDEARAVASEAALHEDPWYRAVGLTALCAVESELRRREEAYEACRAAALPIMDSATAGAIELSNAAAAASEMFKFDEAERLYTEASVRGIEGSVNPWGRLARLYLRQGRFSEALSAWREARAHRLKRPAYLDQQDQSDADLIGAEILLIAGRTTDALRITGETIHRPDRQGTSSGDSKQNEAGASIMDRVARLDAAARLMEEASWSKVTDRFKLWAEALVLGAQAWFESRRAAQILADRERLVTSLRPECPGSIELPPWLDGEVVELVGAGVALAAIREARREERLSPALAEPIFRSLEGEAYLLAGDDRAALDAMRFVIEKLPQSEALLRARAAAIGARAAINVHEVEKAIEFLRIVLSTDPGAIRRLGHTLPVRFVARDATPAVEETIVHLRNSPLFDEEAWGLVLAVGEEVVSLGLEDGTELFAIRVPPSPPSKSAGDADKARWIARSVHRELLVPNVDITQADIRSLDGSLGSGGRASERAKSILDEVLESTP